MFDHVVFVDFPYKRRDFDNANFPNTNIGILTMSISAITTTEICFFGLRRHWHRQRQWRLQRQQQQLNIYSWKLSFVSIVYVSVYFIRVRLVVISSKE
jgi:hypothetical protein